MSNRHLWPKPRRSRLERFLDHLVSALELMGRYQVDSPYYDWQPACGRPERRAGLDPRAETPRIEQHVRSNRRGGHAAAGDCREDASMSVENLILWGFQGTIDYRAQLGAGDFQKLGIEAPGEDTETFVSKSQLAELIESVEGLSIEVARTAGGSPLMSALAAASWFEATDAPGSVSRFVGAVPEDLTELVPEHRRPVLEFATPSSSIAGTLSLEHAPTSAKHMFAVPDGRCLDEPLACSALAGIRRAIDELNPERVLLGFGGLNKAFPAVASELVLTFRKSVPKALVVVSGNSFKRVPRGNYTFWPDLYQAFAEADIVSLSREEHGQLAGRWGDDWTDRLFDSHRPAMVAVHSPFEVEILASRNLAALLPDAEVLVKTAQARASEYAARALTGLGARFDGVLSALVANSWNWRSD